METVQGSAVGRRNFLKGVACLGALAPSAAAADGRSRKALPWIDTDVLVAALRAQGVFLG